MASAALASALEADAPPTKPPIKEVKMSGQLVEKIDEVLRHRSR
jgi:hypothetical protein